MALTIGETAEKALVYWESVVNRWLPGGRMKGVEYEALNPKRADEKLGSFRVNTVSGLWADFATDASGGDLVSLVAYLDGTTQSEAAQRLVDFLMLDGIDSNEKKGGREKGPAAKTPGFGVAGQKAAQERTAIPDEALSSRPDRHPTLGEPATEWAYRDASGRVLFYVLRFEPSEGKKEFRPLSWDEEKKKWRWKMPAGQPPLRGLDELAARAEADVLLCEGEKAADAAGRLLPDLVATCTPGGSASARRADYACLKGRLVFIWPDADGPGKKYAQQAAKEIRKAGGRVRIVDVGEALGKDGGWDAADAEREGIGRDALVSLLAENEAGGAWEDGFILGRGDSIAPNSYNMRLILENRKEWRGVLAYDEMGYRIRVREKPPFEIQGGDDWSDFHDIETRHWIAKRYRVEPTKRDLSDAVVAVAMRNGFHPVRDYLDGLVWDGVPRIDSWISDYLGGEKLFEGEARKLAREYCRLVGSKFLIGSVARVRKPGCKMDNVLILEGKQGAMKSRALAVLWGENWVSDSDLRLGEKDGMAALQGVWLIELAELDSLLKASPAAAKSFFSSSRDRFRPPYGARTESFPRQVVFAGTTNPTAYLEDSTGNRRYWPCHCSEIDLECLRESRDQLWAEADVRFKGGDSWWIEGEGGLVERFQGARMIGDPWENLLSRWLGDWWVDENRVNGDFIAEDQLFSDVLEVPVWKRDRKDSLRLSQTMSFLGWSQTRIPVGGALSLTGYRPSQEWTAKMSEVKVNSGKD